MSLMAELQRRKVFKVGAAYLVVAWLAVQAASIAFPAFEAPLWALRVFILLALLGFPLAVVMAWVFDATPEGMRLDTSMSGSKRVFAGAALLIVLALGWYVRGQPAFRNGTGTAPTATAHSPTAKPTFDATSIAVLPFVDMSQDKDQEYFSDGLSEELLNLLAQLPQLRVIARTSSFSFKGKEVDVATIAKALGVANVLEGSVRKSGNTLRITAQLIRASDSSHLWSQTYDRELTDVFKVQDEIAGAVVDALKVRLLPDQAMSNSHRSTNVEAYNLFLLGNELYKRSSPTSWGQAISAYRQAIALDGQYAAAYAAMARAEGFLADSTGNQADMAQALADGSKAIALAPELSDGYVTRGISRLSFTKDWSGAQADLEKALALNPGDSDVQVGYGRLMTALGRVPEAIIATRKATELDPLSTNSWAELGRLLNVQGQYPEARKALDRSVELSPESEYSLFHRGMSDLLDHRARDALVAFREGDSPYGGAGIAMAEYTLGHAEASQQALDHEIAAYSKGGAYQIAEVYAWRGERDKAFEWLGRAHAQHDGGLSFIKADPLVASLRNDPRFPAFLAKVGLPK